LFSLAQLGQAQPAHDLLHRVGHRAVGALHGDDLVGILGQLVRQEAQLRRRVPVHPVAQAHGLFRLHRGVAQHALFTFEHKAIQAVFLDVLLGAKAEVLFHLHLHP